MITSPANRSLEKTVDSAQQLRLRRFFMSVATYLVAFLATFLVTRLGLGQLTVTHWITLLGLWLCGNGLIFFMFYTGANMRFSEPSLTREQIIFSAISGALIMYWLPEARPIILLFFIPPFSFGLLSLNLPKYLVLVGWVLGIYAGLLGIEFYQDPVGFDIKYELVLFFLFSLLLIWFAFFGGFVSKLKQRLQAQKEETKEALELIKIEVEERKQAEQALRESEEKYRLIVENANDGIEITQDDKIIFSNARFAEMLGYTTSEILNQKFSSFFTTEAMQSLYEREKKRKMNLPVSSYYETSFRKKDGTIIYVDVKYEITEYKQKPATFAIIRDITDRKQAEEALAASDSLRELLLDIITHDLKNPAGVIYSLAEMAYRNSPESEVLETIFLGSERLLAVLQNTTILSQAAFGEEIPKEPLGLDKLLKDIEDDFTSLLESSKMTLEMVVPQDVTLHANPLIGEIFKNYISNALKYAREGGRIVIKADIEDETILISVADFGKTIPEADRVSVFERGLQLGDGQKRGRGLGLAIVKRIAAAHNGEVWVEPNTPVGNRFCLRLPL